VLHQVEILARALPLHDALTIRVWLRRADGTPGHRIAKSRRFQQTTPLTPDKTAATLLS
jgi:hypothetical protein